MTISVQKNMALGLMLHAHRKRVCANNFNFVSFIGNPVGLAANFRLLFVGEALATFAEEKVHSWSCRLVVLHLFKHDRKSFVFITE